MSEDKELDAIRKSPIMTWWELVLWVLVMALVGAAAALLPYLQVAP